MAGELDFGTVGRSRFLREYWQKKPLLLRNALPGFESPLTPDDLAALAQDESVESRLVMEREGRARWTLRNGPFSDADYAALPPTNWSLLVQAVDQHVPAVAELAALFDFLPAWRRDDVMISHAPDGGGVGPHFDYYDVFLIQAEGRRTWRIGDRCTADTPCRDDTPLRILKQFHTRLEWEVEPGDVLYIPPGLAHWGIARGDCTTISVGFRAPSHADIVAEVAATLAASLREDQRFEDPPRRAVRGSAKITPADVDRVQAVVARLGADRALLRDWLGSYMTERKYPEQAIAPRRARAWQAGESLERHPASRFAWSDAGGGRLYVDGEALPCAPALARLLAENAFLDGAELERGVRDAAGRTLIDGLLARGALRRPNRRR